MLYFRLKSSVIKTNVLCLRVLDSKCSLSRLMPFQRTGYLHKNFSLHCIKIIPVCWLLISLLGGTLTCKADERSDLYSKAKIAGNNGDFDSAINCLDKLIQLGDVEAYSGRGFMYLKKKEYVKALADYSERIRLKPNSGAFEDRGDVFFEKGEPKEAVEDYTESIKINPKKGSVYVSRMLQYIKLNNFDAAYADSCMAILLLSDKPEAHHLLEAAYGGRGFIFNLRGKYDRACDDFSKAIEINATNATAYNSRGWANLWLGAYNMAISDYQEAIRFNSKDSQPYKRLGWIMAVCPDAKYRNGQKALEYAKQSCEMTAWKDPLCLITLAAAYAESSNFEAAVSWEQKAEAAGLKDKDLKESQERLELYKQKKPFHISSLPKAE
jgi:tetratricopeptide (TPR) repeat protein